MTWQTWLLLLGAIITEVIGTAALRFTTGFTKWLPLAVVVAGYAASFYLLALVLKHDVPIGIIYAIWSGIGTVGITLVGVILWREHLSLGAVIGVALVIGGVALINLSSQSH
jgi:small multidrug resistance pump